MMQKTCEVGERAPPGTSARTDVQLRECLCPKPRRGCRAGRNTCDEMADVEVTSSPGFGGLGEGAGAVWFVREKEEAWEAQREKEGGAALGGEHSGQIYRFF